MSPNGQSIADGLDRKQVAIPIGAANPIQLA
jgi:hypothetical protein